jgi:chromate reductase
MTNVLLISGSTREASTNTAALRTARALAPQTITTTLYGGLTNLPAFTPDASPDAPDPAITDLRGALAGADAVLFCTPEYAGTLPGSFKNLLDWTVGTADLSGKPVAWVNIAAPGRGDGAEATLRLVLGYVDAVLIEAACIRVYVPRDSIDATGLVGDNDARAGLTSWMQTITDHLV